MTKPGTRDRSLRVPLFDDELEMMHAMTEVTGLSAASLVRTWLREKHAERFGEKKRKGTKR